MQTALARIDPIHDPQVKVSNVAVEIAARAAHELSDASAEDILRWCIQTYWPKVAIATSFQVEGLVIIDIARKLRPDFPIFAIDTGRLPEETHALAEKYRSRGVNIRWYFPRADAVEGLVSTHGPLSFRSSLASRQACCQIRKVEPLRRALSGLAAWVTGRRREHSETRARLLPIEPDPAHPGLVKLNPLVAWSHDQVWGYIREHKLPYNPLYDSGYTSIGCAPCTRAVGPGEHERAGRWWWESAEHRECGIHLHTGGSGI